MLHMTVVFIAHFVVSEDDGDNGLMRLLDELSLVMYSAVRLFVVPLIQTLCSHRLRHGLLAVFGCDSAASYM